jgi:hypothetical protein
MNRGTRVVLLVVGIYLAVISFSWVWLDPDFVSQRVHDRISIGSSLSDVAKAFDIGGPFRLPSAAYCGKNGPSKITRIAVYDAGRVPLLPIPSVLVTTTTFCFDRNDKLVGMETVRWSDK